MKQYKKSNINFAKELRKNMTPWERKLWYEFLKLYSVRFQRQKPIGDYIVDFYCAKAQLIVELDGSGHYQEDQMKKDIERTMFLESIGMYVLRISNLDIVGNFAGACDMIDLTVQKRMDCCQREPKEKMHYRKPPSDEGGGTTKS